MDFQNNVDTILFDAALWGGGSRSASDILRFATLSDGDVLFDFGNGNTLRIENLTVISALTDDIGIA